MADESETMMSATLRFPFQASLDGSAMVETDGNLYYGFDSSHGFAELPTQSYSTSNSDSQSGLGLESDGDQEKQQQQHSSSSSQIIFHPPRWDSLKRDQEQEQEPEEVAPRPVWMHPHRINTSDQQRFATEHEMAAAEEIEEEHIICESPSSSTVDATEAEEESTIRVSVPSSSVQQFIPSRYYATPLIKDDPISTPVALYGLEKPSDHVPRKKAPVVLRQRGNSAAAPTRPSSRHQHQPSPLSSTVNPDNRVEETSRASMSSTSRLSMFWGRTPDTTVTPSNSVSRPTVGSISSAGSSATTSTMRSAVSAVSDLSTATSISASSSPTIVDANQKLADPPSHPTTTPDNSQPTSSFSRPPQPLRRQTTSIPNPTTGHTPITGGDARRNSIFNFSLPKFSSPMMHHRAGIQSSENLTTIRAVSDDQVTVTATNTHPFHDPPLEASSSSSSKQMPFSPDSFVSPHTHAHTSEPYTMNNRSDSNEYQNTNSFSQVNRPHTSHHDQRPPAFSNTSNPQYRAYTRNDQQQQPQLRKPKKSDHHQNRATKLFMRIFVTDLDQKA